MNQEKSGKEFLGKGFYFPVEIDSRTGRFLSVSEEEDICQAVYIILMTRKGERLMHPTFGCGIHDYAFATLDYGTLSRMEQEIKSALILWEPRIREIEVEVAQDPATEGKVTIKISYIVRSTNNPYNLVFPFFLNEGIEL